MSLVKEAQFGDLDGASVPAESLDDLLVLDVAYDDDSEKSESEGEITILVGDQDPMDSFELPKLPGADDQSDMVEEPAEVEVEEVDPVEVVSDPFQWTIPTFLTWARTMCANCPRHSGRDVSGLERAIAYFEWLAKQFSKATQQDIKGELDVKAVEDLRDQVYDAINRLEERREQVSSSKYSDKNKKKKKADDESDGLVKEAQKAAGFQVQVPLFISHLARICINSMVSAGHDIEVTFKKLAKKYDLTKREQAEVMQLLADMNYPVRRDRGFTLDEEIDTTSSDNFDWAANYPA